jgi:hypothetical protein
MPSYDATVRTSSSSAGLKAIAAIGALVLFSATAAVTATAFTPHETAGRRSAQSADSTLYAPGDASRELAELRQQKRFADLERQGISFEKPKAQNCFGVRLPNGARVLGESRGRDYEINVRFTRVTWSPYMVVIGFLFIDGAVQIEGNPTTPGPYVVVASEKEFRLVRALSLEDAVNLSGSIKGLDLMSAFLGDKARPRMTAGVEDGVAYLQVSGHKLRVTAP